MKASIPIDDDARVAALVRLGILDQPPAADLGALTRLASYVTGAPFSFVNLVAADRQFTAAATGMTDVPSFPRDDSFCAHVVAEDAVVNARDMTRDARFADSRFVTGELGEMRAYVGVPIHTRDGYAVGSLCVVDVVPRDLDEQQLAALRDLAAQAEHLLEMRRQHLELIDRIEEVEHYATHDALTGLPNRRVLADRVKLATARAARSGLAPTIFFCDIDGFKAVNDTFGHDVGDATLIAVARHIESVVRPADTVARLGGDEFIVVCEDLAPGNKEVVAGRLRALRTPVTTADGGLSVGMSVGALTALLPGGVEDFLIAADRLMYTDKKLRRSAR